LLGWLVGCVFPQANARRSKKNFQDMEASWHEQRLWGD